MTRSQGTEFWKTPDFGRLHPNKAQFSYPEVVKYPIFPLGNKNFIILEAYQT